MNATIFQNIMEGIWQLKGLLVTTAIVSPSLMHDEAKAEDGCLEREYTTLDTMMEGIFCYVSFPQQFISHKVIYSSSNIYFDHHRTAK